MRRSEHPAAGEDIICPLAFCTPGGLFALVLAMEGQLDPVNDTEGTIQVINRVDQFVRGN